TVVQDVRLPVVRVGVVIASGGRHVVTAGQFDLRDARHRDARLFDEEAHVYAAYVVAFDEVSHIVRVDAARALFVAVDLGGDRLQGRQVLHLFDADHVGQALDGAYDLRRLAESLVKGGLGQDGIVGVVRVVHRVEEALHVEGSDLQFVGECYGRGRRAGLRADRRRTG